MDCVKETEEMIQNEANNIFRNLKVTDIFHVAESAIKKYESYNILIILQNWG